jgi:hypothetical protein
MKIRKRVKKASAQLTFIIIGSGKNIHKTVLYAKDASYTTEASKKITYKIDPDNLMVKKPLFRKARFIAIFKHDGTPVKVEKSDNKLTAEILDLANRSETLGRSIKEEFTTHFNAKKILFFVIIGVIGVVVVLILTGGIKI